MDYHSIINYCIYTQLEQLISEDPSEMVIKAATTAKNVITWKP